MENQLSFLLFGCFEVKLRTVEWLHSNLLGPFVTGQCSEFIENGKCQWRIFNYILLYFHIELKYLRSIIHSVIRALHSCGFNVRCFFCRHKKSHYRFLPFYRLNNTNRHSQATAHSGRVSIVVIFRNQKFHLAMQWNVLCELPGAAPSRNNLSSVERLIKLKAWVVLMPDRGACDYIHFNLL